MSTQTIRILIAGALFVHGIGHTLGIWKPARSLPFLRTPDPTLRLVSGVLWVVIALGFVASAMSFFGILLPAGWWRPLAVVFALISLVMLLLFGRSWPLFNFIGASAMNIAVLVALLWLHWPPFIMFDR
ncbi:MAG TPA: hypothetical protein VMT46_15520 [Anaerolineaceae bacterium]|nr:hypothetical protein [Anaerolineaceae bacterium]